MGEKGPLVIVTNLAIDGNSRNSGKHHIVVNERVDCVERKRKRESERGK